MALGVSGTLPESLRGTSYRGGGPHYQILFIHIEGVGVSVDTGTCLWGLHSGGTGAQVLEA